MCCRAAVSICYYRAYLQGIVLHFDPLVCRILSPVNWRIKSVTVQTFFWCFFFWTCHLQTELTEAGHGRVHFLCSQSRRRFGHERNQLKRDGGCWSQTVQRNVDISCLNLKKNQKTNLGLSDMHQRRRVGLSVPS